MNIIFSRYKKISIVSLCVLFFIIFWNSLPVPLFSSHYSTVLYDSSGQLLNVTIAKDEQWRFPPSNVIPEKYTTALIQFEDKRFYDHLGIDFLSIGRALKQNISSNKTVSGASTLTMQTIRLSRNNRERTYVEKIKELFLAVRLELGSSKQKIITNYANHAPFGGNIVGIDAASWRYFGHAPSKLSWSEACMLAVLPNSPSLVRLDRNRNKLLEKRNRLLKKLHEKHIIDSVDYELACGEPLPESYYSFPQLCPLFPKSKIAHEKTALTSIDKQSQIHLNNVLEKHYKKYLKGNNIQNACAIIIENKTNKVIAYAGNISSHALQVENQYVDIIHSNRSTGSILKPILYSAMLSEGSILPHSLVADVPTTFKSFSPKNYNKGFDGAVKASTALARSLNVPAVYMLRKYGNERFHYMLQKSGMTSITKPSSHYGLSLILGGCEGNLFEISSVYSNMARNLQHYTANNSTYHNSEYVLPHFSKTGEDKALNTETSLFSASSIYYTFKALLNVERPEEESNWRKFKSSEKIAWKTGTSFGFRDAWSIGVTPKYTVGVWTGNADGEGNPAIIGVMSSAPILFDIFDFLPSSDQWFDAPYDDMKPFKVCKQSGMLASRHCVDTEECQLSQTAEKSINCPYHKPVLLSEDKQYRVFRNCYSKEPVDTSWMVLPAHWGYFYSKKHAYYSPLPPFHPLCISENKQTSSSAIKIVYPHHNSKIYIPTELQGTKSKTVFEAFHTDPNATLFWYIDNEFIRATTEKHKIAINPEYGKHVLHIADQEGNYKKRVFEITSTK